VRCWRLSIYNRMAALIFVVGAPARCSHKAFCPRISVVLRLCAKISDGGVTV
jgi:hypothetical protein